MTILHVDGDPSARALVARAMDSIRPRVDVITVDTLRTGLSVLSATSVACVVTEMDLPDAVGSAVVQRLSLARAGLPIVVLAAEYPTLVPQGRTGGVVGHLRKDSADEGTLALLVREALGRADLSRVVSAGTIAEGPEVARFGGADFVAGTTAMRSVLRLIECAAESSVPVLIEGETGTGKEILARAVHARSARSASPFLVQNCGAVAETLLESELFGHVRGAFTGADRDRAGLFLEAGTGTVFLDEIGEAPPSVQARLLRVLQHGEVKAVGSDRLQRMSARIVAATNRPLGDEVRAKRFRADLYYRMTVLPVMVPPLRERTSDIPSLVQHFVGRFAAEEQKAGITFSRDALAALLGYEWPGNVRELEHEVHRLVLTLPSHTRVMPDHLAAHIRLHAPPAAEQPLAEMLARVELALILERLDRFPCKADAARSLGITREALYGKLRRLGAWGTGGAWPPVARDEAARVPASS